jgi:hypothetical protein
MSDQFWLYKAIIRLYINMNGQIYTPKELSIHVYVQPDDAFEKPKLVVH